MQINRKFNYKGTDVSITLSGANTSAMQEMVDKVIALIDSDPLFAHMSKMTWVDPVETTPTTV